MFYWIGPRQIPERDCTEGKRYVDSEMQLPVVAAVAAAKGIPRAGNVRYRTMSCERAWETRHVRRDAEWHPKRATSRATDTVNIAFGTGDVYRMLHAFSRSEHISGVSGRKPPVLSLSGPESTGAPGRCCVAS